MTPAMKSVPVEEQDGLAEEWTEREQPAEPPTEDLRPKRREKASER